MSTRWPQPLHRYGPAFTRGVARQGCLLSWACDVVDFDRGACRLLGRGRQLSGRRFSGVFWWLRHPGWLRGRVPFARGVLQAVSVVLTSGGSSKPARCGARRRGVLEASQLRPLHRSVHAGGWRASASTRVLLDCLRGSTAGAGRCATAHFLRGLVVRTVCPSEIAVARVGRRYPREPGACRCTPTVLGEHGASSWRSTSRAMP